MRRLFALVLILLSYVVAATAQPVAAPLIQASDIQYLGYFTLPNSDAAASRLGYGGRGMGIGPDGTLFIGGHNQIKRLCRVSIVEIGKQGKLVTPCTVVSGSVGDGETNIGGVLWYGGRAVVSRYLYYDGSGSAATASHSAGTMSLTGFSSPVRVGAQNPAFVGGYMTTIPVEWQQAFGGPALTGLGITPIISRTSSGPALSVFDPDDVGRVSPVAATPVLYYPLSNPLADPSTANALYTRADTLGGVAFPRGTRSVLFVGRHGTGKPGYGVAACGQQSECAAPYQGQVWAYDANDLVAVKNGTRQPWMVRPYATWALTGHPDLATIVTGGMAFDPTTNRFYVAGEYGESPRIHVFQIAAPGTPQPPDPPTPPADDTWEQAIEVSIPASTVMVPAQTITIPARTERRTLICSRSKGTCSPK